MKHNETIQQFQNFLDHRYGLIMRTAQSGTLTPCFFTAEDGINRLILLAKLDAYTRQPLIELPAGEMIGIKWYLYLEGTKLIFGLEMAGVSMESEIQPEVIPTFYVDLQSVHEVTLAVINDISLEIEAVHNRFQFEQVKPVICERLIRILTTL